MDFLALCALVIIASCWYRAFIHVYFSRIVEGNRHTRTVSSTGSVGLSNTSTREGAGYFIVMISFLCCSHTPFGSAVSYSECLGLCHNSISVSDHWCWGKTFSSSSQRCKKVRALCRSVRFFHTKLALFTGALSS